MFDSSGAACTADTFINNVQPLRGCCIWVGIIVQFFELKVPVRRPIHGPVGARYY